MIGGESGLINLAAGVGTKTIIMVIMFINYMVGMVLLEN